MLEGAQLSQPGRPDACTVQILYTRRPKFTLNAVYTAIARDHLPLMGYWIRTEVYVVSDNGSLGKHRVFRCASGTKIVGPELTARVHHRINSLINMG